MSIPDSYLSVSQPAEGLYKDKGSKFIGYVFPVKDLDNIKEQINSLKELHPKARHVCFAFRLGFSPEEARSNDDGEPSGSAGKPILNTILSANIHFTLVAVVRYFGGTLLGVPGLIHAYKEASLAALAETNIIEIEPMEEMEIEFEYAQMNEVMKVIKRLPIELTNQEIDNVCRYTLKYTQKMASLVEQSFEFISSKRRIN